MFLNYHFKEHLLTAKKNVKNSVQSVTFSREDNRENVRTNKKNSISVNQLIYQV